jgi:phytol kinase
MVAALMPLTWGDGLASIVGRTYGANTYTISGQQRSLQGSATFMVVGGFFTWLALWIMPGPPALTPIEAIPPSLVITITATITEAVSPWGLDNLTVTGVSIIILGLWPF